MTDTTVSPSEVVAVESKAKEPKDPKVVPALKKATRATGHGLHVAGKVVADANLRSLGKGLRTLGRKIPVRVRIERDEQS